VPESSRYYIEGLTHRAECRWSKCRNRGFVLLEYPTHRAGEAGVSSALRPRSSRHAARSIFFDYAQTTWIRVRGQCR
jgi:hypothetical protein